MASSGKSFTSNARKALADAELQRALLNVKRGFIVKRETAIEKLPEFEQLRAEARAIKDHTLSHLDLYLEAYEEKVVESGGKVHYASTAAEARDIVLALCRAEGAKRVTKGKSMVSEEIGLNAHLEKGGIEVVETDLGEYVVQIRGETPSHIIAPIVHLNKEAIEADFRRAHRKLALDAQAQIRPRPRGRGARRAQGEVPHRRSRHHRRQSAHRRNGLIGDPHQ